jgi:hypothetical protein
MRKVLMLIVAAAALGACHRGAGADSGMLPPMRKAGLWETTTSADGQPVAAPRGDFKTCVDDTVDKRRSLFGGGRGNCSKNAIVKGADGSYTIDRDCTNDDGVHTVSHIVISGDYNAKYVLTTDQTVDGADNPDRNGHHVRTTTTTWLGACPAGMTPGEVIMPDGSFGDLRGMFGGVGGGGGGGGGEGGGGNAAGSGGGQ